MFAYSKQLVLVGLLAALPSSIVAQTTDPAAETTAPEEPAIAPDPGVAVTEAVPEAEAAPEPVEGQIELQSENTFLADDLIGSRIYSDLGETLGDINDLIINFDSGVEGVVIGVGGFLGIGEKDVAVEMSAVSVVTDAETGSIRLILSSTREDLDAAPPFKTAAEQRRETEAEQMQQQLDEGIAPAPTE